MRYAIILSLLFLSPCLRAGDGALLSQPGQPVKLVFQSVAKPDAAFFHHIQRDLGVADTARLLLIDDIPANVTGARAAGWQAIQYGDFPARTLGNPDDLRKALGLGR